MSEHIDNIPDEIFDWLTELDFNMLQQGQKELVLCHFSEEEYRSLHATMTSIRDVHKPYYPDERKKYLLDRFNEKHHANRFTINAEVFWRAAAIILLLISVGLSIYFFPNEKYTVAKGTKYRDTVFIAKYTQPAPVSVHDTVFVKTLQAVKHLASNTHEMDPPKPLRNIDQLSDDLNIVTMEDYGNKLNSYKSNSIKDDHLVQHHEFVSL
jgi:hypothetical protein